MGDNNQVTGAAVWRKPRQEGYVITLPSGNTARLRPVALDVMITSGKLPDILTPIAAKTLWAEIETEEIGNVAEMASGMADLFGIVCKAAFMEPAVVDKPKADNEISLEDISFEDKAAVFQLAIQPAKVLERFREQQAAGVESVPDSKDGKDKAK